MCDVELLRQRPPSVYAAPCLDLNETMLFKSCWLWAIPLATAASPPLSVWLKSSWPAPSILLEVLETAYTEDPASYFPLLSLITTHLSSWPANSSPEALLAASVDLMSSHELLATPGSLATFKQDLALHTATPKIEAFFRYYENTVDERAYGVESCGSWVEWRGRGFCAVQDLRRDMELTLEGRAATLYTRPKILSFDHVSASVTPASTAILYFEPQSSTSSALLNYLNQHAASDPHFQFIVRYRPPIGRTGDGARYHSLSGYGAEMVLKKMDYLAVDDREYTGHTVKGANGTLLTVPSLFDAQLGSDPWAETLTPLNEDEIRDLGLQATTLIMRSESQLDALKELAQNFPRYSAALARKVTVDTHIASEVDRNINYGGKVPKGVWLNGRALKENELSAFGLVDQIRRERHRVLSLVSLGLTPKQAFELLSSPDVGKEQTEAEPVDGLVDASDRPEGGNAIIWWNDIEKDKRYATWSDNPHGYLRPTYPGQFHNVRLNVFNLVFVLDLAQTTSLEVIAGPMSQLIQRGIPFRFGIVPMLGESDDITTQMARLFLYTTKAFGRARTTQLLENIAAETPSTITKPGRVNLQTARRLYDLHAADMSPKKTLLSFDDVVAGVEGAEFTQQLDNIQLYTTRLAATKKESEAGHLFINGKHVPLGGHWTAIVQSEVSSQLGYLQEQIHTRGPPENIQSLFYDLPGTAMRRSRIVVPGVGHDKLQVASLVDVFAGVKNTKLATSFVYPDAQSGTPLSTWIVGDLDSADGTYVLKEALKHLQTRDCSSRVGFVHVPGKTDESKQGFRLSTLLYQLIATSATDRVHPGQLLQLVQELEHVGSNVDDAGVIHPDAQIAGSTESPLNAFTASGWSATDTAAAATFWQDGYRVAEALGLNQSAISVVMNGRIISPVSSENLAAGDFDALESYELKKRVRPVITALSAMYADLSAFDRPTLSHLIASASSIVAAAYMPTDEEGIFIPPPASRNRNTELLAADHTAFTLGAANETALVHLAASFNPLSEWSQTWASLFEMAARLDGVSVKIHLVPDVIVKEVPLRRFYRYEIPSELTFDIDGYETPHGCHFENLPEAPIFTLGLDTPPAWLTSPKDSLHDLDNLRLKTITDKIGSSPIDVTFELKQLVIEGHAREGANVPPRGLQLQLSIGDGPALADTQVVANLGYFQFKADPGVVQLSIREGRGREIYDIESVGSYGWDSPSVDVTGADVAVTSFAGATIYPRFVRKPGMEGVDVLAEVPEVTMKTGIAAVDDLLDRVTSFFGKTAVAKKQADINIFTVASGLLYERFASIMILSVMKHTQSSVKFWFIENFLSPSFLEFIPHLAKEYGFEYELITYKWPSWLRAQTEKQRVIWAYKILFLDVLFPMDLDKVIFVDADQIVRTDLKELVDLDLQGHVYGYAPMGDDKHEMEGFRFWKTGYWAQALRGKPYHISALYVVDLKRFRQTAAGDRLRGTYQALSADPNSLANLDQDLPNSMQDQIPIFTLDQSWLWCETWCSQESLARAKTIDLCQNPLTKQPKLERARQIPEWEGYDQEIAAFASRLRSPGGPLAADLEHQALNAVVLKEEQERIDSAAARPSGHYVDEL